MLDYDTPASISQHFYNGIVIRAHVHSENGTVWLVGADVCKALQITNPSYVASMINLMLNIITLSTHRENSWLRGIHQELFINSVNNLNLHVV